MTAKPAVHGSGPFQIDLAAHREYGQAGAIQGLCHHVSAELSLREHVDHGQTHAVDSDGVAVASIDGHHGSADDQTRGIAEVVRGDDLPNFLNDSGEHGLNLAMTSDPATTRPRRRGTARPTHYDAPMSTTRRIFAALAALFAAALLISGCSKKPSEPLPDAAGLLQQSIAATKALQSAHLEIVVNGKVDGLPIKRLSGDLTNVPAVALTGSATISMGGSDLDVQGLVVLDGTLYATLTPNSWLDMGPAADIYDASVILNPDAGLANMLTNITDAKAQGFETIGGVPTVKISGTVAAAAVNKLIPPLKASGPLPATVWIEKDAPNQLVQAQVDQSEGNSVQLTLSEWDKPVTVTKPAV